jgi:hypothetical protein
MIRDFHNELQQLKNKSILTTTENSKIKNNEKFTTSVSDVSTLSTSTVNSGNLESSTPSNPVFIVSTVLLSRGVPVTYNSSELEVTVTDSGNCLVESSVLFPIVEVSYFLVIKTVSVVGVKFKE